MSCSVRRGLEVGISDDAVTHVGFSPTPLNYGLPDLHCVPPKEITHGLRYGRCISSLNGIRISHQSDESDAIARTARGWHNCKIGTFTFGTTALSTLTMLFILEDCICQVCDDTHALSISEMETRRLYDFLSFS
jgi:hypothetical protein